MELKSTKSGQSAKEYITKKRTKLITEQRKQVNPISSFIQSRVNSRRNLEGSKITISHLPHGNKGSLGKKNTRV